MPCQKSFTNLRIYKMELTTTKSKLEEVISYLEIVKMKAKTLDLDRILEGANFGAMYDAWFETFWLLYPKNNGSKNYAFKTIEKNREALKKKQEKPLDFLFRVYMFRKFTEKQGTLPQFIPHCSTWINRLGWEDVETQTENLQISTNHIEI